MYSDLRFAFRQLRKRPGSALAAVLVLALGLGASTAVFSVFYESLLKPLPYPGAGRIVFVHNSFPKSQLALAGVSSLDDATLRRHKEIFAETGIYFFNDLTMTGVGAARHVDPVNVSASLFRVLGVKPELGRAISAADDQYGAPKVAVLSDAFWRTEFQANPGVLGRSIQLDGEPYRIVGVMPRDFEFPYPATQLWLPVALRPIEFSELGRSDKWLHMIARLAPSVTPDQAQAALLTIGHQLARQFPAFYPERSGWHFSIKPLFEEKTQGIRAWLLLAFGAVLCVFLLACSNAGGLLLIRSTARTSELAIRAALGAGRYRIVRQILAETLLLAFTGCGAGIVLAAGVVRFFRYAPVAHGARIQAWTILFAIAMALIGAVAAGLAPAFVSAKISLAEVLKSGATRTATRASGWRSVLLAGQVALALTLVSTAILLSRSFVKLMQVPTGFTPQRVWTGTVALPRNWRGGAGANLRFFEQLISQLNALPGVQSASGCTSPPFNASGPETLDVFFPGRTETAYQPQAQASGPLPGYFETMKIPLLKGRFFDARDGLRPQRVLIVDQEFARLYFPGEDPIGKLVGIGGESDRPGRIIGVVGNVENSQIEGRHKPEIYWPFAAEPGTTLSLIVRTKNDTDITSAVREEVTKLDRNIALFDAATMDQRIAESLKLRRFLAWLLSGFAAIGLTLAALGLYGSLAHLVQLRRREIGIRIALGATRREIISIVVLREALAAAAGLVTGAAGAALAGLLMRN